MQASGGISWQICMCQIHGRRDTIRVSLRYNEEKMASAHLKREALKAWVEYGQAVVKAFNFPKGSVIAADGLQEMLANASDSRVREFIAWVRKETETVRSMKFVGEP